MKTSRNPEMALVKRASSSMGIDMMERDGDPDRWTVRAVISRGDEG